MLSQMTVIPGLPRHGRAYLGQPVEQNAVPWETSASTEDGRQRTYARPLIPSTSRFAARLASRPRGRGVRQVRARRMSRSRWVGSFLGLVTIGCICSRIRVDRADAGDLPGPVGPAELRGERDRQVDPPGEPGRPGARRRGPGGLARARGPGPAAAVRPAAAAVLAAAARRGRRASWPGRESLPRTAPISSAAACQLRASMSPSSPVPELPRPRGDPLGGRAASISSPAAASRPISAAVPGVPAQQPAAERRRPA